MISTAAKAASLTVLHAGTGEAVEIAEPAFSGPTGTKADGTGTEGNTENSLATGRSVTVAPPHENAVVAVRQAEISHDHPAAAVIILNPRVDDILECACADHARHFLPCIASVVRLPLP